MKPIMESWNRFLNEQQDIQVERKPEEESKITYRIGKAFITILENSPYADGAHSVYNFYVPNEQRGQGLGKRLAAYVVERYSGEEISAQVSSLASLKVFIDLGFKPYEEPTADFARAKELFDEDYGSLNLRLNAK